jgi:hypothetical protein
MERLRHATQICFSILTDSDGLWIAVVYRYQTLLRGYLVGDTDNFNLHRHKCYHNS